MNLFTLGDKDFLITVDYTKIILKWIGLDKDSIIEEDSKRADLRPLSVGQMVRLRHYREEKLFGRKEE